MRALKFTDGAGVNEQFETDGGNPVETTRVVDIYLGPRGCRPCPPALRPYLHPPVGLGLQKNDLVFHEALSLRLAQALTGKLLISKKNAEQKNQTNRAWYTSVHSRSRKLSPPEQKRHVPTRRVFS